MANYAQFKYNVYYSNNYLNFLQYVTNTTNFYNKDKQKTSLYIPQNSNHLISNIDTFNTDHKVQTNHITELNLENDCQNSKLKHLVNFGYKLKEFSQPIEKSNKQQKNNNNVINNKTNKLGVILDLFTSSTLNAYFELVHLTPTNFKEEIDNNLDMDFLFVESVWYGNNGLWANKMNPYGELGKLIKYCNKKGIKTVFWNKEDPVHYNQFIKCAKLFDYIFTTDENTINDYKKDVGHDNIYPMAFFIDPNIHFPDKTIKDNNNNETNSVFRIGFAGSWYNDFGSRMENTKMLFDGVIECIQESDYNIEFYIFDRRLTNDSKFDNMDRFPGKYNKYIYGAIPYDQLLDVYKQFDIFLNVNSVVDSIHMCSRRVYELLACKTSVISSTNTGMKVRFSDYMDIVENKQEVKDAIKRIIDPNNKKWLTNRLEKGHTIVMSRDKVTDRFKMLYRYIGLGNKIKVMDSAKLDLATKKTIGFWGYWKGRNFGDIWIRNSLEDKFKEHFNVVFIYCLDNDINNFKNKYKIDYLVIGGGGLLSGPLLRHPFNGPINIPYSTIGLGGELPIIERNSLNNFINNSDLLGVRDTKNKEFFGNNDKIIVSGDCTFMDPLDMIPEDRLYTDKINALIVWRDPYSLLKWTNSGAHQHDGEVLNILFKDFMLANKSNELRNNQYYEDELKHILETKKVSHSWDNLQQLIVTKDVITKQFDGYNLYTLS
jgi:hypothetical protein